MAQTMSAALHADLQVIFVMSVSGLRCEAAIAARRIGVSFRCNIHDVKQRADYTTIGATSLRCIA